MPGDGHLLDRPQAPAPERGGQERSATRARGRGPSFSVAPSSERRAMRSPATRSSGNRSLPGVIVVEKGLERLARPPASAGSGRAAPGRAAAPLGRRRGHARAPASKERRRRHAERERGPERAAPRRRPGLLLAAGRRWLRRPARADVRSTPTPVKRHRVCRPVAPRRRRARLAAETEERAQVVLRQVAAPGTDLANLRPPPPHSTSTRAPIANGLEPCLPHVDPEPVVPALLRVLEQRGLLVHRAHHDVGVAVVVEVADGEAAARLLHGEAPPGRGRHVAEPPALVQRRPGHAARRTRRAAGYSSTWGNRWPLAK